MFPMAESGPCIFSFIISATPASFEYRQLSMSNQTTARPSGGAGPRGAPAGVVTLAVAHGLSQYGASRTAAWTTDVAVGRT